MATDKSDTTKARKLIAFLSDEEWRRLRVRVVEADTTIQAHVTKLLLRDLNDERKSTSRARPKP